MLYLNISYIYITLQLYELQEWQRLKWFHDSMPKLPCHFRGNISAKDCLEGFSLFGQWDNHRGSLVIHVLSSLSSIRPSDCILLKETVASWTLSTILSAVSCRVVPWRAILAFWSRAESARCASHRSSSMAGPRRPKKFTTPASVVLVVWVVSVILVVLVVYRHWNLLKLQSHFSNLQ